MAEPDSKSNMPWSVKGVSKEARDAVKKAAAEQGITMGEWLTQAIRADGESQEGPADPGPQSVAAAPTTELESSGDDGPSPLAMSSDTLRAAIAERIVESELRLLAVVEPLQDIIEQLAARIEALEDRSQATGREATPAAIEAAPAYRQSGWDE